MEGIKEKVKKGMAIGVLALATIAGTFTSHKNDCAPLYVRKIGTSYGIAIGGRIRFEEGAKFYGIAISFCSEVCNGAQVNGADVGFVQNNAGKINGLSLGAYNASSNGKLNGLEAGLFNMPHNNPKLGERNSPSVFNGVQLGICNGAATGNGIQIGVFNSNKIGEDNYQRSLIINPHFTNESK